MSAPSVRLTALSNQRSWAHHPTTAFPPPEGTLAILPVHGMAEHHLGLSWDLEEVVGTTLLEGSLSALATSAPPRVLPPLRLGLAPYQPALSSVTPDEFLPLLRQIARGVKSAGFSKLAFWSTHPWNPELIDVASRDIRVELDLQTFVVEMGALGFSLHPNSSDRARCRRWAAEITGRNPESTEEPPRPSLDATFRPGNWCQYPPVPPAAADDESGDDLRLQAMQRLAGLWQEILARSGLTGAEGVSSEVHVPTPPPPATPYPENRRHLYLPALTPTETAAVAQRDPWVILPVGAVEQHGPHLPVGVDSFIAEAAATGLSERLGVAAYFGPTLAYGKSNEHHDFPGTIDLGASSLRQLIGTHIRSLHALGFRRFAVLNTHGGNSAVLVYTLRELQTELGIRAGMLRLPGHPDLSDQEQTWGFHAGEWETSVMLAIAPHTVRMEHAVCHYPATLADAGELRPENAPAIYSWQTSDIAPDGVMGDATRATPEKGTRWFAAALDAVAEQIRRLN